jgi:hypothetical protein
LVVVFLYYDIVYIDLTKEKNKRRFMNNIRENKNVIKLKWCCDVIERDKYVIEKMKVMENNGSVFSEFSRIRDKLSWEKVVEVLELIEDEMLDDERLLGSNVFDKLDKLKVDIEEIMETSTDLTEKMIRAGKLISRNIEEEDEEEEDDEVEVKKVVVKEEVVEEVREVERKRIDFKLFEEKYGDFLSDQKIPILMSESRVIDLVKMPHLLIAGQTGSGKSVFLNVLIMSVMSKTKVEDCKLVLIDPKRVEFAGYRNEEHLLCDVVTSVDDIECVLDKLVEDMDNRYELFEKVGVKSYDSYNKLVEERMEKSCKINRIVVVIDEFADLMMMSEGRIENKIIRLAQLARAVGIHLVLATQRPIAEIMTGLIKSNMPSRISFKVVSKQDSRMILDETGAEKLKGKGEMIFIDSNGVREILQGVYLSEEEINEITNNYKKVIVRLD